VKSPHFGAFSAQSQTLNQEDHAMDWVKTVCDVVAAAASIIRKAVGGK
jgi:hypothetical protein